MRFAVLAQGNNGEIITWPNKVIRKSCQPIEGPEIFTVIIFICFISTSPRHPMIPDLQFLICAIVTGKYLENIEFCLIGKLDSVSNMADARGI